jgi:hypothetical protein
MKYHLTIWTDDGIKREFDVAGADLPHGGFNIGHEFKNIQIMDTSGKEWFFNWNHVLGGTIAKIEEK